MVTGVGRLDARTVFVMANDDTVKAQGKATAWRKGQKLFVLEAMKMQNEAPSPVAGRVAKVHAREGQVVDTRDVLVALEP